MLLKHKKLSINCKSLKSLVTLVTWRSAAWWPHGGGPGGEVWSDVLSAQDAQLLALETRMEAREAEVDDLKNKNTGEFYYLSKLTFYLHYPYLSNLTCYLSNSPVNSPVCRAVGGAALPEDEAASEREHSGAAEEEERR